MTFLRRAWYCFGWSNEISRQPKSRMILGEPIVVFRKEDGAAMAIGDTCPHRLAPLHLGIVKGDAIECPYHGLQFGETGACTVNPHGATISKALKVPAYPLVERHKAIWLWMGEPELADPKLIPDYSSHDDPKFKTFFDLVPVAANYEMVTDNLLDLTHVNYLHKSFQSPNDKVHLAVDLVHEEDTVTSVYNTIDTEKSAILDAMWPEGPARIDVYSSMRWNAPATLLLRNCNTGAGRPEEEGMLAFAAHIITPETETSSHYFWSFSRNYRLDDEPFEEVLHQSLDNAIRNDDVAMIDHIQRTMGETGDLMAFRPVILPTDGAAMRARLIIAQMRKNEAGGKAPARGSKARTPASEPADA